MIHIEKHERLVGVGPNPGPMCKHEQRQGNGEIVCAIDGTKCFQAQTRQKTAYAFVSECDRFEYAIDDTARLEFLLKHIHIKDEDTVLGIVLTSVELETELSVGVRSFDSDLRDVIDNAIAHTEVTQKTNIFNLAYMKTALDETKEHDDMDGNIVKSVYIGSVFDWVPSGKYYTPIANSNVTEEEAEKDEEWYEQAEAELDTIGAYLTSGEGDPTDMFAEMFIKEADE